MLGGGLWGAATEATSEPPNTCIQLAVLGWLRIEEVVPLPEVEGIPIPTWLLLGGTATGIAVALLAQLANGAGAKRRARRAARSLASA